jgi:hypothetical protein
MACIASTFTGSVAALKASKVQVSIASRALFRLRSRLRQMPKKTPRSRAKPPP